MGLFSIFSKSKTGKPGVIITEELANAITRFIENGIESSIYSGQLREYIMGKLKLYIALKKVFKPNTPLTIKIQITTIGSDLIMLQSNLESSKDSHLTIEVKK